MMAYLTVFKTFFTRFDIAFVVYKYFFSLDGWWVASSKALQLLKQYNLL